MKAACWMLSLLALAGCLPAAALQPVDAAHARELSDAQFPRWLEAERSALRELQDAAHSSYAEAELKCWHRFAVNDCLHRARVARRSTLDALLDQQLQLNALERERRAAQRRQSISGKTGTPANQGAQVAPPE